MLLTRLSMRGFRCYAEVQSIPFHRLTVFIGENDSGKTCILDALELLLTAKGTVLGDYHTPAAGDAATLIEILGEFRLEAHDNVPNDLRTQRGSELHLTKRYSPAATEVLVEGRTYAEPRWASFPRENAEVQKELLQSLGLAPGPNKEARIEQSRQAMVEDVIPKIEAQRAVPFAELREHLPVFERVASAEYNNPEAMVQRTLRAVVDAVLQPVDPETHEKKLLPQLDEVAQLVKAALDRKLAEMRDTLRRHNPDLINASVEPAFDFSRGLTATNLTIDAGAGPKLMTSFGEGMKKKLWMALLDWEEATRRQMPDAPVFRVYDEPDVNLDYAAERRLFAGIRETTTSDASKRQAVVCTHSLTLVDRAPASSINLIQVGPDSSRSIQFLGGDLDEEVESFLGDMGRSLGLSNSALFYERAFLLVEGESEENALPHLYRNLYRRGLFEDGIILVNLRSCGAWKGALGVIRANKAATTVVLLDSDCRRPGSSAKLTPERLTEVGFPPAFLADNCFFVGVKEFEDAFATGDILVVLNSYWPKEDGTAWTAAEVDVFREGQRKFSRELLDHVRRSGRPDRRSTAKKPEFAQRLARHCITEDRVPEAIRQVFCRLRILSGTADGGG